MFAAFSATIFTNVSCKSVNIAESNVSAFLFYFLVLEARLSQFRITVDRCCAKPVGLRTIAAFHSACSLEMLMLFATCRSATGVSMP